MLCIFGSAELFVVIHHSNNEYIVWHYSTSLTLWWWWGWWFEVQHRQGQDKNKNKLNPNRHLLLFGKFFKLPQSRLSTVQEKKLSSHLNLANFNPFIIILGFGTSKTVNSRSFTICIYQIIKLIMGLVPKRKTNLFHKSSCQCNLRVWCWFYD